MIRAAAEVEGLGAVTTYAMIRDLVATGGFRGAPEAEDRVLSAALAEARIVELATEHWKEIEEAVDGFLRARRSVDDLVDRFTWPPYPLPFDAVWLAATSPIRGELDDGTPAVFLGFLLTETHARAFIMRERGMISVAILAEPGERVYPHSLGTLLVLAAVLGYVDHQAQTLVLRGLSPAKRRKLRRITDKVAPNAPIPKAYHRILVQDRVLWVSEAERVLSGTGPAWTVGHRFDVRGHWRLRVRRGALPLAQSSRAKMEAAGYVVAAQGSEIPDDLADLLRSRGIARQRPGEWLAVLRSWVRPHQRGPEDAPLVPAVWHVQPRPDELIA